VFHAQVCARQSLHTFTLVAHPKTPAARAASWPWTWAPGDSSLDGTFPRPGLPCSRGLRNSLPFPPAAHAASWPWTWVPWDRNLRVPSSPWTCNPGLEGAPSGFGSRISPRAERLQGSETAMRWFPTGGPACTGSAALPSLPAHRAPLVRLGNTNLPFLLWGGHQVLPAPSPGIVDPRDRLVRGVVILNHSSSGGPH